MITFERTLDYELVRSILTHPLLYPHLSDDHSPPAADYRPIEHEAIWYVLAKDGETTLGLWIFHPQNGITWEIHTALLPCAWGDIGLAAARELPAWIWANTQCRRIITNVPSTNRLALHFALKAGMKMYGVNIASFLKEGRYCDQLCLGISPPEIKPEPEVPELEVQEV